MTEYSGFDNANVPMDDILDEENPWLDNDPEGPWDMDYEDELEERAANGEFDDKNEFGCPREDGNNNLPEEKDVPPIPEDFEIEEE